MEKMEIKVLRELWVKFLVIIGSCLFSITASEDFLKSDHKHRTHKAAERANELWCYKCSTMDIDKEYCMNVSKNDSSLHQKCDGDMRACMVKRISYTTTTNGSSNKHKLWSLERNCSQKCDAGCIIIGERLKLYKCTSCCEGKNFCNYGSGASITKKPSSPVVSAVTLFLLINRFASNSRPRHSHEEREQKYISVPSVARHLSATLAEGSRPEWFRFVTCPSCFKFSSSDGKTR